MNQNTTTGLPDLHHQLQKARREIGANTLKIAIKQLQVMMEVHLFAEKLKSILQKHKPFPSGNAIVGESTWVGYSDGSVMRRPPQT